MSWRILAISILLCVWALVMLWLVADSRFTDSGDWCKYYQCNKFNERGEVASPSYNNQFITK